MDRKPLGFTGGMGTGKSTVLKMLSEYSDIKRIDTDSIAKQFLFDPRNQKEIKHLLGPFVFTDGKVDGGKVGQIIFSNEDKKHRLEGFIHPLVEQEINRIVAGLSGPIIPIVESAIIFKIGWEKKFSGIIVAHCQPDEVIARLRFLKNMSIEEIQKRLGNQIDQDCKVKRADLTIDTTCSFVEMIRRANKLYHEIRKFWNNLPD